MTTQPRYRVVSDDDHGSRSVQLGSHLRVFTHLDSALLLRHLYAKVQTDDRSRSQA